MAAQNIIIIFLLIVWPALIQSAETCDEKYINLQLAHTRLQLDHYRLRQQPRSCPQIQCSSSDVNPSSAVPLKTTQAATTQTVTTARTTTQAAQTATATTTTQAATTKSSKNNANLPRSCKDVEPKKNGVYEIHEVIPGGGPLRVACDFNLYDGGWTIIQRRTTGNVNFNRPFTDYQKGFGNIDDEYWLGLDNIHALTKREPHELLFYMEDFDNQKRYARYTDFYIADDNEKYALLRLGKYSGDAGDSFSDHLTARFSTSDQDNDTYEKGNCARTYKAGWWFNHCLESNLNGPNIIGEFNTKQCCRGLHWLAFRGEFYSLKHAGMMIRPLVSER